MTEPPAGIKLFQKRKRTPKPSIPFTIPFDRSLLAINWSRVLRDLRDRKHRFKNRLVVQRRSIKLQTQTPSTLREQEKRLTTKLISGIRLTGVSSYSKQRLDELTHKHRTFLEQSNLTSDSIAEWWCRLHKVLPDPIFITLLSLVRAIATAK